MTQTQASIRLATTAIAAALAISTTPLMAQETPAPDTSAGTPAPTTPDPLAPAPATDTNVAPETTVAPAVTPSATERTSSRATRTAATRAASRPAATTHAAPARAATAAPKAAPPTLTPEPVPVETAIAAPATPPAAAPAAPPAEPALDMNEALPLAGAGAVGLLALAGTGLALRRRKRRQEELDAQDQWVAAESEPMAAEPAVEPQPAAPAFATAATAAVPAPRHDPVDEKAPAATVLPSGFDISRFGRHVQAAYRGPTPDNPSLSLKYRLRKATALDQRERREVEARVEPVAEKLAPSEGGFILRGDKIKTVARPAYSR